MYNIHPILVHFPIALLFIYSIIKILPFQKWLPSVSWKHIERVFLVIGLLGAFAALGTGDDAEHAVRTILNRELINMHAIFAGASVVIYGLIFAGEFITVVKSNYVNFFSKLKLSKIADWFEKILCNSVFSKILALLGLIVISLTGLLGGAIVYGATADPFASVIIKMLGINM